MNELRRDLEKTDKIIAKAHGVIVMMLTKEKATKRQIADVIRELEYAVTFLKEHE